MGFLNATSLKRRIRSFRHFLFQDYFCDLFGVAETRLGPEASEALVEVEGYSFLRQNRSTGGESVLPYVRNNLNAKILYQFEITRALKKK